MDDKTNPKTVNLQSGRVMDCIDCHNQPTHVFHLPAEAMDDAMAAGRISPALPYVKKEGVALLQQKYASQSVASQKITDGLEQFYKEKYPAIFDPQHTEISKAAKAVVAIYCQNVFPKMKVTWGTYPNNLGHMSFPGCFRCHGTLHAATDPSKMVPQDCGTCHNLLAMSDPNPKILTDLGISGSAEPQQ